MMFILPCVKVEKQGVGFICQQWVGFIHTNEKVINKIVVDKSLICLFSIIYLKIVNTVARCKSLINNGIIPSIMPKKRTFANYLSTSEK